MTTDPQAPAFRLARETNAYAALGLAVAHLMTRPAFATSGFAHLSRILAGQINRKTYGFVLKGAEPVGFVGWALTGEAEAEGWLAGTRPLGGEEALAGDCVLLNVWQADSPAVSRFLIGCLTRELVGARMIYARRHYPDGRIRPVRLPVGRRANAFSQGQVLAA